MGIRMPPFTSFYGVIVALLTFALNTNILNKIWKHNNY